jgi:hypothetical protein
MQETIPTYKGHKIKGYFRICQKKPKKNRKEVFVLCDFI